MPELSHFSVRLPRQLKIDFKSACKSNGLTMREDLSREISACVEKLESSDPDSCFLGVDIPRKLHEKFSELSKKHGITETNLITRILEKRVLELKKQNIKPL